MIRAADAADLPAIERLERDEFGPDAWTGELLATDVRGPGRQFVVAEVEGRVIGYAVTRPAGDAVDLTRIAVAPASRRQGVASALLRRVCRNARACGGERMLLEVAADNDAALELYRGAGFTAIARRPRYYRDGSDALVLQAGLATDSTAGTADGRGSEALREAQAGSGR